MTSQHKADTWLRAYCAALRGGSSKNDALDCAGEALIQYTRLFEGGFAVGPVVQRGRCEP